VTDIVESNEEFLIRRLKKREAELAQVESDLRDYRSAADAEASYADDLFKKLQSVKQQLGEANKVISFYGEINNWWMTQNQIPAFFNQIDKSDISISSGFNCGGFVAREYCTKYNITESEE